MLYWVVWVCIFLSHQLQFVEELHDKFCHAPIWDQQQIFNNSNYIYCTDSENLFRSIAVVLSSLDSLSPPDGWENFMTEIEKKITECHLKFPMTVVMNDMWYAICYVNWGACMISMHDIASWILNSVCNNLWLFWGQRYMRVQHPYWKSRLCSLLSVDLNCHYETAHNLMIIQHCRQCTER